MRKTINLTVQEHFSNQFVLRFALDVTRCIEVQQLFDSCSIGGLVLHIAYHAYHSNSHESAAISHIGYDTDSIFVANDDFMLT